MPWNSLFKVLVVWLVLSWGFWSFVTWDLFPFLMVGGLSSADRAMLLYVELTLLVPSLVVAFTTVQEAE